MVATPNARYPYHLARLVEQKLASSESTKPNHRTLLRLFETLYFASLKTDETRPCRCTVNYLDPQAQPDDQGVAPPGARWETIPFRHRLPLTVRTLVKLADAADPSVSSLCVFHDDEGELFIWGMADQELRYGDYISLDAAEDPRRAGLFQATITGVGCVSVYQQFRLMGSLEQHSLISDFHEVMWEGPVHDRLKEYLESTLADIPESLNLAALLTDIGQVKKELLVRWQNAVCRLLFGVQQYGHGGGLLLVPELPSACLNIKYDLHYQRLPDAIFDLARHQFLKAHTADSVTLHCGDSPDAMLPCDVHFNAIHYQRELRRLASTLVGTIRFIASLSRVDGFVLMDRSLIVRGFGVEARSDANVSEVFIAGDALADEKRLLRSPIAQFGTRHRAMLRYCYQFPGSLGFVISQDGDIRATMRVGDRLVLWENVNVQLAYRAENAGSGLRNLSPITGLFQYWMRTFSHRRAS